MTPTHIRGLHPYVFRSGQWAEIVAYDTRFDGKNLVLVKFSDDYTDVWVLDDPQAEYEFK